MVRNRFDNLDDEKREEILEAAGEEFADKGYERASINQIIKRAGISKGSLYYYFEDKADLFSTVFTHATERFLELSGGLNFDELTAENFWDQLEESARRGIRHARSNSWFIRLSRSYFNSPKLSQGTGPANKVREWALRYQERFLRCGQELGVVRSDVPIDYLLQITMAVGETSDRMLLNRWDEMSDADLEEFLQIQLDLYKRILSP